MDLTGCDVQSGAVDVVVNDGQRTQEFSRGALCALGIEGLLPEVFNSTLLPSTRAISTVVVVVFVEQTFESACNKPTYVRKR